MNNFTKAPKCGIMPLNTANTMLDKWHYLGGVRSATCSIGFADGCTVWGVLRSRAWHAALKVAGFTPVELIRMVGSPGHKWAVSSLLAQSVKILFKDYDFNSVLTYADPMQEHTGAVYRAANWQELPERAQPDGYTWRLDGKIVSRKRFYAELGTSAIGVVKKAYGDRITLEKDIPKYRFCFLKNQCEMGRFFKASKKKKTWGINRIKQKEGALNGGH